MQIIYIILIIAVFILFLILNICVKHRYIEEAEFLDTKQYPYKNLLPFGMWLFDEIGIPSAGTYYVFLHQRVVMVYGSRYAQYYLKIHWAEKFLYFISGIVIALFFGAVSNSGAGFLVFTPVSGLILFFLADKNLDERAKKRKLQFMMDFPVFISKLTLLMNAGMHLRQALERIYTDSAQKSPFYVELGTVLDDFASGLGEGQAWQDFSERCKVKEISSFASMIMQNSKIGGRQLVDELKKMTYETWEMRKNAAKQMGETASAKLIFPLMLMFLAVLLIVITPAIMQFSGRF
jgi:tight adherence protein C